LEKHQNSRDRIDKDIVIDATIQFTTSLCQIQMNSIKRNAQVLFMLISSLVFLGGQSVRADQRQDFFETKIRPVLIQKCFKCHGDTKASGGFRVDSRERLLKGGDSGPAIVPGKPVESRLIHAIQRQGDASEMPPEQDQALRADEVANFVTWIKSGAFWPAQSAKFESVKHWAYEPIRNVDPPKVQDKAWANTSVDPFIQRRQEEQGVLHAPTADKRTLIRRATFDLTGLPPTPDETTAFIQDTSPHAFASVINRLLKSPAYGERWGRHWLDVVRYADTAGETADYPVPLSWRYRNYVIDAFNSDKPYDEFLREQIAGDIIANQGAENQDSAEKYAERVTATGYLAISRRFGFDSENYHHLTVQDTIDNMGQTMLGLSLGCARCHDHKFDAVSMQDYYGLYGIFDSSRYPFPGSEQKQKMRSMASLLPSLESKQKWHEYEARKAALSATLTKFQQPIPTALLRSLHDIDGDIELQAAAGGGSNGVLVSPWLYSGNIAVAIAAQSPFRNLYSAGRVGIHVPVGEESYSIQQALYPSHTIENGNSLYVNLDFRVTASDTNAQGVHRFSLGSKDETHAAEVLISSESVSLKTGEAIEVLSSIKLNEWHNLQLTFDLNRKTISGKVGLPGSVVDFSDKPMTSNWNGLIDLVTFDSTKTLGKSFPAIDFDNLGAQKIKISPVTQQSSTVVASTAQLDPNLLNQQLHTLLGNDGDFELQDKGTSPAHPWGPGPNSVVNVSTQSQSPFQNIFPLGKLGLHMPNRAEYDGVVLALANIKLAENERLFVNFDFRCADNQRGGDGSWRFYLGHGPGNSAAIELFMNGKGFFRRTANVKDLVAPVAIGQWYQVQLELNLKSRTYTGQLTSAANQVDFIGQFATGWDGMIDKSFIDSYGHIGGVRPAIDTDNFVFQSTPLPAFNAPVVKVAEGSQALRRTEVDKIRQQLVLLQSNAELAKLELNQLLEDGPFAMAYAMSEGTPHDVRMQLRGDPSQLGDEVPRGFIKALKGSSLPTITKGSGRLELAQWLTRADNPLISRVMINRVWQHHFEHGLVKTSNDFGTRGLPPTHPDLLDHLATRFMESGWSVKAMHRLIMLSATYQQASSTVVATSPDASANEDVTDLYTSFPHRRLSAEEIRDSILAVSGALDTTVGHEHPFPAAINWGFTQHGPFLAEYNHNKRSVYLMTQRLKRHSFLALFDGADPNTTTTERMTTTVPTQALFFLNSSFVYENSAKWASQILASKEHELEQIELAWQQAYLRRPSETERAEALKFLKAYRVELGLVNSDNIESRSLAALLRTLIGSNEFLHVD
jgi:hypothetical protein